MSGTPWPKKLAAASVDLRDPLPALRAALKEANVSLDDDQAEQLELDFMWLRSGYLSRVLGEGHRAEVLGKLVIAGGALQAVIDLFEDESQKALTDLSVDLSQAMARFAEAVSVPEYEWERLPVGNVKLDYQSPPVEKEKRVGGPKPVEVPSDFESLLAGLVTVLKRHLPYGSKTESGEVAASFARRVSTGSDLPDDGGGELGTWLYKYLQRRYVTEDLELPDMKSFFDSLSKLRVKQKL